MKLIFASALSGLFLSAEFHVSAFTTPSLGRSLSLSLSLQRLHSSSLDSTSSPDEGSGVIGEEDNVNVIAASEVVSEQEVESQVVLEAERNVERLVEGMTNERRDVQLQSSSSTLFVSSTTELDVDLDVNVDVNVDEAVVLVVAKNEETSETQKSSSAITIIKPISIADMQTNTFLKVPIMERLSDAVVTSVKTMEPVNLSTFLQSGNEKTMLILATYAADFNAIEYVQRLRFYLPQLKAKGIDKIGLVLNCEADAAKTLVTKLDLDTDATTATATATADESDDVTVLFVDPTGEAGRKFGVGVGWRADDDEMSPFVKLFGMLLGLGAWATLPAVIGGYTGNPFQGQPWIEDALAVGQKDGRWPKALDINEETGDVVVNKFKELPIVGDWKRRPLELATLRLQNMVDISIKNWGDLAPHDDALKAGVLTQLGGCVIVDAKTGEQITQWRDPGICAVANFEGLLRDIEKYE